MSKTDYSKIILQAMRDVATETFAPSVDVEGYRQRMAEAALNRRANITAPDWDSQSAASSGLDPFNTSPVDHSAIPAEPAEDLNGPWGNREVAADRNAVDDRTITNLPYRYEPGSGEIASQPRVPKIKG